MSSSVSSPAAGNENLISVTTTVNRLEAIDLAKSYQGHEVVKSVSLHIQSGDIVGLLGPNGAGKTTCFYMIVGLINNDKGRILLNGSAIDDLPIHQRAQKGIGYLPQEASVFRNLSVEDNIMAVLQLRKRSRSTTKVAAAGRPAGRFPDHPYS